MDPSEALFKFNFLSNEVDGPSMAVTLSDSTQVLTCAYACGFRLMKSEALLEIFCGICHIKSNEVSKAIVTERKFWNALQQFLPDEIPEEVHSLLASIFHSCTSNLGANIKWSASLAELICILSLFCGGSKPQKLAFTFYIFGEVEDGIVKEEEFLFMLSTILKGVCLLTAWGQNQDPGDLSSWAQMASEVTLQRMLYGSLNEEDGEPTPMVLSFRSFGGWYNAHGYKVEEMDIVFHFPVYIDNGCVSLVFIREDVEIVVDTAKRTGLDVTSPTKLAFLLKSLDSKSNSVSASAFNTVICQIFTDNGLPGSEHKSYARALFCLFLVFDSENKGIVDADDLSVGLSILCAGNKSKKLIFAFNAMDTDNDGLLDQRGLRRLFHAVLLSLFSLSSGAADLSTKELASLAENAALWLSSHILSELNTDMISFEDMASWYSHKGVSLSSILELLDLRKWAVPLKLETGGGNNTQVGFGRFRSPGPDSDGLEVECKTCPIHPNEPPTFRPQTEEVVSELGLCPNFTLRITREDMDFIRRVLTCSQLGQLSPKKMKDLMHNVTGISQISENVPSAIFSHFAGDVIIPNGLSVDDENVVSFALNNIFGALESMKEVDGDPKAINAPGVPLRDILCGLAILCEESVEAKMLFMFGLYEIGPDTPRAKLRVLLCSALQKSITATFACLGQTLDFNTEKTRNAVINVARHITEQASFEPQHVINLLKAIDVTQWVLGSPTPTDLKIQKLFISSEDDSIGDKKQASGASVHSNNDSQPKQKVSTGGRGGPQVPKMINSGPPKQDKDDQAPPSPQIHFVCEVSCAIPPLLIRVSTESAKNVVYVATRTGLGEMEVSEVYDIFFNASENNLLDKGAFDSCIKRMIPRDKLQKEERRNFSALFSSIYYAFGEDGNSTSDARELAAGFSTFCKGGKTSKLSYAFKAMDEDSKGGLSKREMSSFIRAFLTTLVVLSQNHEDQTLSKEVARAIDEGAIWTSASIFFSCEPELVGYQTPYIKFNQFASWYNKKGFTDAPWLEMLSLCKWAAGLPQTDENSS